MKNQFLEGLLKEHRILIAAHRGIAGGNIIQNTPLAFKNALLHGANMIEIDVAMTTDGVFYAFHDGQESVLFGTVKNIREMTSEEVDSKYCNNSNGLTSKQQVAKLGEILPGLKNQCLINIDRSWFYWKETIHYLNSFGINDQIILKSPVKKELLEKMQELNTDIMYMPIVKTLEEWEMVREYQLNLVAAELIFETLDSPLVSPGFLSTLHENNILTWVNAITLDDTTTLSAHIDDNLAISCGFDESWGRLMDMGFKIIQTDWPALLSQYILQKNELVTDRRRKV